MKHHGIIQNLILSLDLPVNFFFFLNSDVDFFFLLFLRILDLFVYEYAKFSIISYFSIDFLHSRL